MPPLDVDALILDLVATGRNATPTEVAAMVAHVAQAPFAARLGRVPPRDRVNLARVGIVLPPGKVRTIESHLLKRIYIDEQWSIGTTEAQFEADLHQAILHPDVQVWTYRYTSYPYIGFMSPSHVQHVPKPKPYIYVAYSPVYRTMTTGYQASGMHTVLSKEMTDVIQHQPSTTSGDDLLRSL